MTNSDLPLLASPGQEPKHLRNHSDLPAQDLEPGQQKGPHAVQLGGLNLCTRELGSG